MLETNIKNDTNHRTHGTWCKWNQSRAKPQGQYMNGVFFQAFHL
uniref:Uncharacterized protein n=1 Tax=Candidatus Kentrum sp. FW TaxID=2126338 RepID=A0A450SA94_9GAMM|nr:MAG: hypothetical protein BECKFW1821A_GA0114235_102134 [Candidatus Kentron sp. FW]